MSTALAVSDVVCTAALCKVQMCKVQTLIAFGTIWDTGPALAECCCKAPQRTTVCDTASCRPASEVVNVGCIVDRRHLLRDGATSRGPVNVTVTPT